MNDLPADIALRYLHAETANGAAAQALLSAEERRRLETFADPKRRREFALGRAAARLLLSERLAVEPSAVPLRVAGSGAVEVAADGWHVSISHSGYWAVAAAAPRPVGVDIERIASRAPELAAYLRHPDEPSLADILPIDKARADILCWTLKEATLKAMQRGLGYSAKKLRLDVDFGAGRARVRDAEGGLWEAWFEERDGYYAAASARMQDVRRGANPPAGASP